MRLQDAAGHLDGRVEVEGLEDVPTAVGLPIQGVASFEPHGGPAFPGAPPGGPPARLVFFCLLLWASLFFPPPGGPPFPPGGAP